MKITSKFNARCRKCGGEIKVGETVDWTRGAGVTHFGQCPANEAPKNVAVGVGVFRKADGRIFVVKPNREKTRFYAKEIVESPARMTESGLKVDFETIYRPGAIYDLSESERWDLAEARDFLTKYARCIVCGAHLKAAKSVAGAIGPVCAKYFANHGGCDHKHADEAPEVTVTTSDDPTKPMTVTTGGMIICKNSMTIDDAVAALGANPRFAEQPVELTDDDDYFRSREEAADRYENEIVYGSDINGDVQ